MVFVSQMSATHSPGVVDESIPRRSLHEAGAAEALRYKWIESERAGHDLGEGTIHRWIHLHWANFVRDRWIEHLEGRVFWVELDRGDFGILGVASSGPSLLDEVVRRIRTGGENLDILCWSHEMRFSTDEVWRVVRILEELDINGHRVECEVLSLLSQAG